MAGPRFSVHSPIASLQHVLYAAHLFGFRPGRPEWTQHLQFERNPETTGWWDAWPRMQLSSEEHNDLKLILSRVTEWMETSPTAPPESYSSPGPWTTWQVVAFANDPFGIRITRMVEGLLDLGDVIIAGSSLSATSPEEPAKAVAPMYDNRTPVSKDKPYLRRLSITVTQADLRNVLMIADAVGFTPPRKAWRAPRSSMDEFLSWQGWWDGWAAVESVTEFESYTLAAALRMAIARAQKRASLKPANPKARPWSWGDLDSFAVSPPGLTALRFVESIASLGSFRISPTTSDLVILSWTGD